MEDSLEEVCFDSVDCKWRFFFFVLLHLSKRNWFFFRRWLSVHLTLQRFFCKIEVDTSTGSPSRYVSKWFVNGYCFTLYNLYSTLMHFRQNIIYCCAIAVMCSLKLYRRGCFSGKLQQIAVRTYQSLNIEIKVQKENVVLQDTSYL